MKIGITLSLTKEYESLWINGIKLNILNLAKTLMEIPGYEVFLLDTGNIVTDLTKVSWDYNKYKIFKYSEKIYELDILFMIGTSLAKSTIDSFRIKNPKIKVVKYQCGNNYVIDMERVIFNTLKNDAIASWDSGHDETWLIPQQEYQNKEYYKAIYRQNSDQVKVVPFIWDSEHLDNHVNMSKDKNKNLPWYIPNKSTKDKKISIIEPNINVVKYSMIPILISENLFRKNGEDSFKQVYIVGGANILKNGYYKSMIKKLDLVTSNPLKLKYVGRYPVITVFSEETDIVLSHQWENPLNYSYLDALHFNFPLVHNADMIKDAGYYYDGFNVSDGTIQLENAINNHDNNIEKYNTKSKKVLYRYLSTNPKIVETYRMLIENLFEPNKYKLSYKYNWKTNLYK